MIPDFLAVGHVTVDRTAHGVGPGGSAYYAAHTAYRLGLRVGLFTSFGPEFPAAELPPGLDVLNIPSGMTTTFEIEGTSPDRKLRLLSRAADLEAERLPPEWRVIPLVLLCPVAGEVDPLLAASFPDSAVGVAPQGWLRHRGAGGAISPEPWEDSVSVLPHAQSLVVSAEDIAPFEDEALEWFEFVPMGAVTRGREGATLFVNGEPYHVAADRVAEVSDIGAGDVFAATLLIEYHRRADPWEAAAAAACGAAASVEHAGARGVLDRAALEERLAAYRRRRGG